MSESWRHRSSRARRIPGFSFSDVSRVKPGRIQFRLPTCHLHSSESPTRLLRTSGATHYIGRRSSDSVLSGSEGLDNLEGPTARFEAASGGSVSDKCGHGGPGVCLGDG